MTVAQYMQLADKLERAKARSARNQELAQIVHEQYEVWDGLSENEQLHVRSAVRSLYGKKSVGRTFVLGEARAVRIDSGVLPQVRHYAVESDDAEAPVLGQFLHRVHVSVVGAGRRYVVEDDDAAPSVRQGLSEVRGNAGLSARRRKVGSTYVMHGAGVLIVEAGTVPSETHDFGSAPLALVAAKKRSEQDWSLQE